MSIQAAQTLIRSVCVVDPIAQTVQSADVVLSGGALAALEPAHTVTLNEAADTLDGEGCVLAPGLVDLYSQSGEPGHEARETRRSLLAAAQAGGFSRVGLLPTTVPAIDHPAQVAAQRQHHPSQPRLLPWGAITLGTRGEQLTDLAELAASGAVGFSDGLPIAHPVLVQRLLEYVQPLQLPVALWPCDRPGAIRDGADAIRLGLPGVPAAAESAPLAMLLEQVAETHTPVHIMRVSTARSVALIEAAKQRGLPVTASVVWLHLLWNTQDLAGYDPNLKLAPPVGTPADQAALVAGLEAGVLDAIAVDHTAHTYEEKTVPFSTAPPGAIGLALALPLLWQTFVATQRWQPWQLWRYLSTQPAQCLGQAPPQLAVGQPAELVLFDPEQTWTVSSQTLMSLSSNTPWLGQQLQGKVRRLWLP